jgi:hypothetical protein
VKGPPSCPPLLGIVATGAHPNGPGMERKKDLPGVGASLPAEVVP